MHGVAFDANLLAIRTDNTDSCASSNGCQFYDSDIASGVNYAMAHGAKIINISLGGDNAPTPALRNAMNAAVQQGAIIVIAAGNDYDATAGTGNDPTMFAQYANETGANGQVIIAGAAKRFPSIQIADYSNRAGNSVNVYLLAPADGVETTKNGGGYTTSFGGTSLATPFISSAAALLEQAFPSLTPQQVVQLLLSTATDLGASGPDTTNGMGFLNIEAAFAPQGTVTIRTPQAINGTSRTVAVGASMLALGPAFGDALSGAPAGLDTVALNSYSRAYSINLGDRVLHRAHEGLWSRKLIDDPDTAWVGQRLGSSAWIDAVMFDRPKEAPIWHGWADEERRQGLVQDRGRVSSHFAFGKSARWTLTAGTLGRQSMSDDDPGGSFLTGLSNDRPYLSLVERGTGVLQDLDIAKGVTIETTAAFGKRRSLAGRDDIGTTAASTGLRFAGVNWAVMPKAGFIKERGGILGGSSIGFFALDTTAMTRFLGLDADLRLTGGWTVHADGTAGWTSADGGVGPWSSFSTISTSAFRMFASGDGIFRPDDHLRFGVGQPLRVESGRANIVLPSAYSYNTESFTFGPQSLDLSPTGREIDFEAVYSLPLGHGAWARANLVRRHDAGHIAGVSDTAAALQFRLNW